MDRKWFLSLWYVQAKLCTYIAPTLTLSSNEPKRDSTLPTHLGVPLGASKTITEPMECSAQTMHLSCVKISTISKRTQTSFHLSLVTKEYHLRGSKMVSEPMVCLAQTVHLYCTDTNTAFKWTKSRFHMTHSPRISIG
jgi:hypothetical protein